MDLPPPLANAILCTCKSSKKLGLDQAIHMWEADITLVDENLRPSLIR